MLARLVAVVAVLVVVPGFLLVQAIAPRAPLSRLERAYLSLSGGLALVTIVAVVLGFLPHGERGYLQTSATGAPYVEITLGVLCLALLAIGVVRGGYSWMRGSQPG